MKKNLLLPHAFKKIGWVLFVPFALWAFATIFFWDLKFIQLSMDFSWSQELMPIGIAISMLMVGFSREKDEDEYTAAIRSYYLTLAFYIDTAIILVGTLALYDIDYLNFMMIQMFLVLFIYIILFNIAMLRIRRANKRAGHEE